MKQSLSRSGKNMANVFVPFAYTGRIAKWVVGIMTILLVSALGYVLPFKLIPNPTEIFMAFPRLWNTFGLGAELIRSTFLAVSAIGCSAVISLLLAYLSVIPVLRPLVQFITKLRFTSLNGVYLIALFVFSGSFTFKLFLLSYGITVFLTASAYDIVKAIPKERFDHARTLGMSKIQIIWEVVVLGTIDSMWDAMVQNGAMAFMMLTVVEGLVRSGGGVGVLLRDSERFQRSEDIYAIQISILILGTILDFFLGWLKQIVLPYASIKLERR